MDLVVATRNPSKVLQVEAIFEDSRINILTLADAGIEGDVIENGNSLRENALKKARFAHENAIRGMWTAADDTGFFIKALNEKPGIHAARWAGEDATTEEVMQYTLNQLRGADDRSAVFRTVVAVIAPNGEAWFFEGSAAGTILDVPRCPPQPKMPYSGIFLPNDSKSVWAEMTPDEENKISHRGKALRKLKYFLEGRL